MTDTMMASPVSNGQSPSSQSGNGRPNWLSNRTANLYGFDITDPFGLAAWGRWLDRYGEQAAARRVRVQLNDELRCSVCGRPLTSLASLRRGAGKQCAAALRCHC